MTQQATTPFTLAVKASFFLRKDDLAPGNEGRYSQPDLNPLNIDRPVTGAPWI